jgi:D-glycero-alpha-D-manno-heptose-7-phosphate kinase
LGKDQHDLSEIVLLAHNIEDSLCGNTGLQDQAAAAFGGVHMWEWRYGSRLDFVRHSLLSDPKILDEHIVLAYTGEPHPSSRRGSALLHSFKQSGNLETLNQISVQARNFAKAIQSGDYEQAGHALLAEFDLRSQLVPQVLHREDYVLVEIAREAGCGAKFTGRGKGGCIWAIGPKEPIRETRQGWKGVFGQRGTGHMLPATIAREGLQVVVT